jgi:hypothetical protein
MDGKVVDIILQRLDKLEGKIDTLLEFKWKIVGGTIFASLLLTGIFQLCLAFIEGRH